MNIFAEAALNNPLGPEFGTIAGFVKGILGLVMYMGIPMIGLVLVYAGFKFLFARGKSDQISKAVFNIKWAILGIAIFLGAWALANLVDSTIKSIMNG
jgi:hypothetical protein